MAVIMALLEIIVVLIVAGVIWWAIEQLLPLLPLPDPFRRIIRVLLVVILVLIVLWVIVSLLGLFGASTWRLGHVGELRLLAAVYA